MTTKKTAVSTLKVAAKKAPANKVSATLKPTNRPAISAAKIEKKPKKEHKKKVVRDSFTMPQDEYQKIAEIKEICLKAKMHVKKSEVLRAGLKLLAGLSSAQLKQALSGLEKIKTGRPQKH